MSNRRTIWREFMGRFEPSASPQDAVGRGFYVPRPGRSMAEDLAKRFELKPEATHLLIGGIGSGKTTQLLVTQDELEAEDVAAVYLDASIISEPDEISSSSLLAGAGIALGVAVEPVTADEKANLKALMDPLERIARSSADTSRNLEAATECLADIQTSLQRRRPYTVLLVDSLDRMTDIDHFSHLLESAIAGLRSLRIGVILVGPLTVAYGLRGTLRERFDRTWQVPAVDVLNDVEGKAFLVRVLQARDADKLLTDDAMDRVATLSGGVLRDLIALTQTAGEEAYVDGADRIDEHHVDIAADVFGRKQLFAIDSKDLAVLQRVRTDGTFVQTSEKDLALLATRRVLEYGDGKPRFAVHPTIEPLLAQIPKVA